MKARADVKRWREENPEKAKASLEKSRRVTSWAATLVSSARIRSRKFGWPECDLTAEYVLALFEQQGQRCYWLGVPVVPSVEHRDPRRPSLDRLVTSRGYVRGNVVVATMFANMGRSNVSPEKFAAFVAELRDQIRNS